MIKSKQNILEELNRIRGLMGVIKEQTTNQNTNTITPTTPSTVSTYASQTIGGENKEVEEEWITKYKEACGNNEYLLVPTTNEYGAEGEDTLVKHYEFDKDGHITKEIYFCMYSTPNITYTKVSGSKNTYTKNTIWLPSNIDITFWDNTSIQSSIQNFVEKRIGKDGGLTYDVIQNMSKNINDILKPKQVNNFVIDGQKYGTVMEFSEPNTLTYQDGYWYFKCYGTNEVLDPLKPNTTKTETYSCYTEPKWTDPRNEFEKFMDSNWSTVLEILVTVGFSIASALFPGAAYFLLIAEIAAEGSFAIANIVRCVQTGNNIGVFFNALFGLTPFLKLSKTFRGVDESTFRSLSDKIANSNLTDNSTKIQWKTFLENNLEETERNLFYKVISFDELSEVTLKKEINNIVNKPGLLFDEAVVVFKENPNLFKPVKFFSRVNSKEITIQMSFMILNIAAEIFLGEKLNNQQKEIFSKIYSIIPQNLQKEFTQTIVNEIETNKQFPEEKLNEILEVHTSFKKAIPYDEAMKIYRSKFKVEFKETYVKDTSVNTGYEVPEFPEDKLKDFMENNSYKIEDSGNKSDSGYTLVVVGDEILYTPKSYLSKILNSDTTKIEKTK